MLWIYDSGASTAEIERGIERQEAALRVQRGDYPYVYRAAEEAGLVRDWPYDFCR